MSGCPVFSEVTRGVLPFFVAPPRWYRFRVAFFCGRVATLRNLRFRLLVVQVVRLTAVALTLVGNDIVARSRQQSSARSTNKAIVSPLLRTLHARASLIDRGCPLKRINR